MSKGSKNANLKLTQKELNLLNSPLGYKLLLLEKKTDVMKSLKLVKYENRLKELQAELVKVQDWMITHNKKIIILFEGRDAAGKGGAIRRLTAHINPRHYRIMALPKPTDSEKGQWYFQRYVQYLPKPAQMVLFDRSWYNRAIVEPVNKFCTAKEYKDFMGQVNEFERMIMESDTHLIKFYFSITKQEQKRRFDNIQSSPLKRWKMTAVDKNAQALWDEYTRYKLKMFKRTNTKKSPWIVIDANDKTVARIKALEYILDHLPYQK